MGIELHCPGCAKLIRAPDDAGGKRGKCPHCKQSVYIPILAEDTDVIALAPVDEEDERHAEALRQESISYATSIDRGPKATAGDDDRETSAPSAAGAAHAPGEVVDVPRAVERFIRAMRDSKLDEADRVVGMLEKTGTRGRDYVEGLILDEMPPTFEDVPPPLLKGFLKKLLDRLG